MRFFLTAPRRDLVLSEDILNGGESVVARRWEMLRLGVGLMDSVLTQGFMGISSHPMNSSQNFLGLLGLCEVGNHPDPEVRLALLGRMLAAIRFRDDSHITKLFTAEAEKPEVQNMNRLFCGSV